MGRGYTLYWSLGLNRFQGSGLFFRSQLQKERRFCVCYLGTRTLGPGRPGTRGPARDFDRTLVSYSEGPIS
jgi:hypothetical protein